MCYRWCVDGVAGGGGVVVASDTVDVGDTECVVVVVVDVDVGGLVVFVVVVVVGGVGGVVALSAVIIIVTQACVRLSPALLRVTRHQSKSPSLFILTNTTSP